MAGRMISPGDVHPMRVVPSHGDTVTIDGAVWQFYQTGDGWTLYDDDAKRNGSWVEHPDFVGRRMWINELAHYMGRRA